MSVKREKVIQYRGKQIRSVTDADVMGLVWHVAPNLLVQPGVRGIVGSWAVIVVVVPERGFLCRWLSLIPTFHTTELQICARG